MAFNLLAVSKSPIDWPSINERYRNTDQMFELFPVPDAESGDALGISIPMNHFNPESWNSASSFLKTLSGSCSLEVFDMYAGHAVDITTYVPEGIEAG